MSAIPRRVRAGRCAGPAGRHQGASVERDTGQSGGDGILSKAASWSAARIWSMPGELRPAKSAGCRFQVRFRRRQIRRCNDQGRRQAVRHRARRQDHQRAGDPGRDLRRQRHHQRQLHRRRVPTIWPCCCARARCRQLWNFSKSAASAPSLAPTPSRPARWRAIWGWRSSASRCSAVYGLFGIFANVALVFNFILLIGAMSPLQATLTLPGIAGHGA